MKTFLGCLGLIFALCFLLGLIALILLGSLYYGTHPSSSGGNSQVVQNALAMAAHLHNGGAHNYDVVMDTGFPREALAYWDSVCGTGCGLAQNGNLQCGVFVGMAYGWAGLPLINVPVVIDWWNDTYANQKQPGWLEISNGMAMPAPGDILILDFPPYGTLGHAGIVVEVTPHALTFAEANGPTPLVTWSLDEHGALIAAWPGYVVKGFLRHLAPAHMPNSPYVSLAWQDAQQAGIDPSLFVKQIDVESGFNPKAKSSVGAEGIAQLMPTTAASLGVDPWNPVQALHAAAFLMSRYVHQYAGDYQKALAAYNDGPGGLQRAINTCGVNWLGCMPQETQHYVLTILMP